MTFPVTLLFILVIAEALIIGWLFSIIDGIHQRIDGIVKDTNKGFNSIHESMTAQREISERTVGVMEQMNQNYFGLKEDIGKIDKNEKEIRTYYMNYVSRRTDD